MNAFTTHTRQDNHCVIPHLGKKRLNSAAHNCTSSYRRLIHMLYPYFAFSWKWVIDTKRNDEIEISTNLAKWILQKSHDIYVFLSREINTLSVINKINCTIQPFNHSTVALERDHLDLNAMMCAVTPLLDPQHRSAIWIGILVQLDTRATWFSVNKRRWRNGEPSLHR